MVRVHEAVGTSPKSWDAAVMDAVRGAKDDAPDPIAVEVIRLWADLGAREKLARYRAQVKIAYRQALVRPPRSSADRSRTVSPRSRSG